MSLSRFFQKIFSIETTANSEKNDDVYSTTTSTPVDSSSSNELAHINQEMYKKSAELSERNKALSLLQKINELILGSITHPEEVAKQVVSILVMDKDFQTASIFLYEKEHKLLRRLARAYGKSDGMSDINASQDITISLNQSDNLIVQAINEKSKKYTDALQNVLIEQPPESLEIKSVFISPLSVRNEIIGAIVIGMQESQDNLSDYRKALLSQVSELVGIGIDNSLLYNEVQKSNEQLKELDKLKDEFVSVASHELRTPMTAIKSYLWMALSGRGGDLNEKQRYYVQRGYNSVDRLIRLVNDMLNISRIESGRITVDIQEANLLKLTQDVVDEVMPRADELGVKLVIQRPESLPLVLADQDKIKEVLFNLIGNSLKFTPKDGTITISYYVKDNFVEVHIKDTGVGLEADDIGKLFQKFGLLPGSYTTNQSAMGTGLGLYICKSIIELHKGRVWAGSEGKGKGATFSFTLKIYNEADAKELKSINESEEKVDLIHSTV